MTRDQLAASMELQPYLGGGWIMHKRTARKLIAGKGTLSRRSKDWIRWVRSQRKRT